MLSREDTLEWAGRYDLATYPDTVYRELVIDNHGDPQKFIVLGAWKTGSLRCQKQRVVFIDSTGVQYGLTERWKDQAPVGKQNWEYINEHIDNIAGKVPVEFPVTEPEIVTSLRARTNFGFIWSLFVMHCVYPDIYPLYDQHVFRAFIYETTNGKKAPRIASNHWSEYLRYRNFFNKLKTSTGLESIILDRGLWTYGKSLKQARMVLDPPQPISPDPAENYDSNNTYMLTLGNPKPFSWNFDGNKLDIIRSFKNQVRPAITTFGALEIDLLQTFMEERNDFVPLDNSVSDMQRVVSKIEMGIGKFIRQKLNRNNIDAQASSQLAALFYAAGIWEWNGRRNGMKFRFMHGIEWNKQVEEFGKTT